MNGIAENNSADGKTVDTARRNNFNILRLIATFMVIYGHMPVLMGLGSVAVFGMVVHEVGVKILFVISGYLITVSFMNDDNFIRYMVKRCFRIFPGLIGVVLFSVFIVGPLITRLPIKEYLLHPMTADYLKNILLKTEYYLPGCMEGYAYPNAVNGSLWTLPIEFLLYLLLPLTVVVFRKIKVLVPGIFVTAVLFCFGAYAVLRYPGMREFFANAQGSFSAYCPHLGSYFNLNVIPDAIPLFACFYIGSFLSLEKVKKYCSLQVSALLLILSAMLSTNRYELKNVTVTVALAYFVISFATAEKPVFSGLFTKCDFTYGLYLYSFVIQQVVNDKLKGSGIGPNLMTVICFAVTFAFAAASWYIIEKPAQKLGKRIIKRIKKKES